MAARYAVNIWLGAFTSAASSAMASVAAVARLQSQVVAGQQRRGPGAGRGREPVRDVEAVGKAAGWHDRAGPSWTLTLPGCGQPQPTCARVWLAWWMASMT